MEKKSVLRSRHFFGRLRTSEVPEPTPAPGKKKAASAPGKKGRLRLLTLTFLISALKNGIINIKKIIF